MRQPKRIILVDECAFLRRSIRSLVEVEPDLRVCAESSACAHALRLLSARRPDLLILELESRAGDLMAALREIRRSFPHLPILVLTQQEESLHAESALRAGADGYVMKRDAPELLLRAVAEVLNRRIFVSPAIQQMIFNRLRAVEASSAAASGRRRSARRVIPPRARGPKIRSPAR
ncbi:MAG: response regulator transcription factor [Kiritimatiellae bacterium]|nr:response regulator transcription factor [Kiritimatiellia bacterium]